jgi:tetrapyrrole methylase family protein/MazG family protein
MNYPNLEELIKIIATLRSENGCQWDREQTHYSLKKNMIEEAYEAVDAIDNNDMNHLQEELGDVLLQVVLHSQIAKEENNFTIEDVALKLKINL